MEMSLGGGLVGGGSKSVKISLSQDMASLMEVRWGKGEKLA